MEKNVQVKSGSAFAHEHPVTAIDIALEPDALMTQRAQALNARLLKEFQKGYALDSTHHPHITLLQRYVRTADIQEVCAAVRKISVRSVVTHMKLRAYKYFFLTDESMPGLGSFGMEMKAPVKLIKLQQTLINAVAPYTERIATAAAFYSTPGDRKIDQQTIHYVEAYVPEHSGERLSLHVTTGIATINLLQKIIAEPFEEFDFWVTGVGLYHLGHHGTARVRLRAFR